MLSFLSLGFFFGLAHACEADHLAAVSSLVTGRLGRADALRLGALWGLGHTVTLLGLGGGILLLGQTISQQLSSSLELGVGLMLIGLGGHLLYRLRRDRVHVHLHSHGDGRQHLHLHSHAGDEGPHRRNAHTHGHPDHASIRSLFVGMMHGLAGSAAIVLLAATSSSPLVGLLYITLFGAGSIIGMATLSVLVWLPLRWTAGALTRINSALQMSIGGVTIGVGVFAVYQNATALL